jgi:hypothetical protein
MIGATALGAAVVGPEHLAQVGERLEADLAGLGAGQQCRGCRTRRFRNPST